MSEQMCTILHNFLKDGFQRSTRIEPTLAMISKCTKTEAFAARRCGGRERPRIGGAIGGVGSDRGFRVDLVKFAGFSWWCH